MFPWIDFTRFSDVIHGGNTAAKYGQYGGAWNYQWVKFFQNNSTADANEILIFAKQLVDLTSDFSKRTVDDIDWPFKVP